MVAAIFSPGTIRLSLGKVRRAAALFGCIVGFCWASPARALPITPGYRAIHCGTFETVSFPVISVWKFLHPGALEEEGALGQSDYAWAGRYLPGMGVDVRFGAESPPRSARPCVASPVVLERPPAFERALNSGPAADDHYSVMDCSLPARPTIGEWQSIRGSGDYSSAGPGKKCLNH
jgi:hypothetical protein